MIDPRFKTFAEAAFEGVAFVEETRVVDASEQLAEPLKQVYVDLIGNALDHHDRHRISATSNGAFFEFTVADDGPGIEERYHQKIFEVFQSLPTSDDRDRSGVGLSLAKRSWVSSALLNA